MRAREQAGELVRLLEARGASVRELPMIRIEPPADPGPLRRAVRSVDSFDWVVFLSVNGVEGFWRELRAAGLDARALAASRVACVGPGTAAALARRGVAPAVVPEEYVAEALLEALARAEALSGKRILLPRGAGGRAVLPEGLRALGAEVTEVEVYRTVPEVEHAAELRELLRAGAVDALVFTSPSTVGSFVASVGVDPGRAVVAAIGPVTARAAAARGLAVHVCAAEHTMAGLVEALASRAAEERRGGRRV
jgi:uroporphyrinogen III methyltransferase/synthase